VAHSLSAKKRIRQTLKRNARNRARKTVLKEQIKTFNAVLAGGDMAKAEAELNATASRLGKIAASGTLHKNAAARKRSRLAKKLNLVKANHGKLPTAAVKKTRVRAKGKGTKAAKA
jgi:small subunit ribosomal protein S20